MTNLFDYLIWRGDLTLSQSSFSDVDSLALTALAYVFFDGIVPQEMEDSISLGEAVQRLLFLPEEKRKMRVKQDLRLLKEMGKSRRFSQMRLCGYVNQLDFAAEKQFAALTALTGDGLAFVAYRGTDRTLVGWKEDFNMSFLETVPSHKEAEAYLAKAAGAFPGGLRVGGHSKGGNLAVYAAAVSPWEIQRRIVAVYNHDGPGFREEMLRREGYRRILPKIQTFVPQTSVFGMLLEHEEAYTVIRSGQIGIFQHDPYSWEVLGADFIRLEALTEQGRFLDHTMKKWLGGLTASEREQFTDALYEVLSSAVADKEGELFFSPGNALDILHALKDEDEETKQIIGDSLKLLLQAAVKSLREYNVIGGRKPKEKRK